MSASLISDYNSASISHCLNEIDVPFDSIDIRNEIDSLKSMVNYISKNDGTSDADRTE